MVAYIVERPLYFGAGKWKQPGETVEMDSHDAKRLGLRAERAKKAAPEHENKIEPAAENKAPRRPKAS